EDDTSDEEEEGDKEEDGTSEEEEEGDEEEDVTSDEEEQGDEGGEKQNSTVDGESFEPAPQAPQM
ncbi:hypothetical protein H0H92_015906, partial [Tricholoma furcatifolium]